MSNYILLKDIPDAKAGTVFSKYDDDFYKYVDTSEIDSLNFIHRAYVEHNPEWFREYNKEQDVLKVDQIASIIQYLAEIKGELQKLKIRPL